VKFSFHHVMTSMICDREIFEQRSEAELLKDISMTDGQKYSNLT
jgi:hypothetical protein